MKEFAKRLKELRLEKNLSTVELGKQIGVSGPTISRWENNVISPNAEKICLLAKVFDVSSDYLLGLTDY